MAKAGSSRSPLSRPQTLIHRWASDIQEYLYLPDPTPFYVVLGTLVANMMAGGESIWMMLVGNSGCGKSTAVRAIETCPRVTVVDVIEGKAGLMSGSSKKDRVKGATGGLLFELGQRGLLACEEFTATLSQDRKALNEALSMIRLISGGKFDRTIGSDGGRRILWRGNIGFIGGSTSAIDSYSRAMGQLGQRWVFYRYPGDEDGYQAALKGLNDTDKAASMKKIQDLTAELIESLSIDWSCYWDCNINEETKNKTVHVCHPGPHRRTLSVRESNRLVAYGTFTARARSVVPRDEYSGEINEQTDLESPNRMVQALGKIYLALDVLGLGEKERWVLVERIAWDSISPRMREVVLSILVGGGDGTVEGKTEGGRVKLSLGEAEQILGVSGNTTRKVIGDLKALGVVTQTRGLGDCWASEWLLEELGKARGKVSDEQSG